MLVPLGENLPKVVSLGGPSSSGSGWMVSALLCVDRAGVGLSVSPLNVKIVLPMVESHSRLQLGGEGMKNRLPSGEKRTSSIIVAASLNVSTSWSVVESHNRPTLSSDAVNT